MSSGRKKLGTFLRWVVGLGVVGGGIGYFALRKSASDLPITFKTVKVDKGSVEQTVTATGQLNAVIMVQVGTQVSGIIQSLGADFNSRVKAGQIIAQIEPTRIKASLQQSRAQLRNAEASLARARVNHRQAKVDWDRAKALSDKQVVGAAELDQLRSKLELAEVEQQAADAQVSQARASVGMIQIDLDRTIIRSPIDGIVLQRAVDVGQTVAASLSAPTIFTIAQDLSKMEVRTAIDEADVGKLKEGLEARFSVDAHPGREFVATIFQIRSNPNVAQNVVTYDAILRVDNIDEKLRPGMTANVRIVTERRENVLRVANAALRFKPPPEILLASAGGGGAGGGHTAAKRHQGRRQQPQLTNARLRQQQLGEHAMRPTAAGQLGVQRGKAAGPGADGAATQLAGAPHRRVQCGSHAGRLVRVSQRCWWRRASADRSRHLRVVQGRARRFRRIGLKGIGKVEQGQRQVHSVTVLIYSVVSKPRAPPRTPPQPGPAQRAPDNPPPIRPSGAPRRPCPACCNA